MYVYIYCTIIYLANKSFKVGELVHGGDHLLNAVGDGATGDGVNERLLKLFKALSESLFCLHWRLAESTYTHNLLFSKGFQLLYQHLTKITHITSLYVKKVNIFTNKIGFSYEGLWEKQNLYDEKQFLYYIIIVFTELSKLCSCSKNEHWYIHIYIYYSAWRTHTVMSSDGLKPPIQRKHLSAGEVHMPLMRWNTSVLAATPFSLKTSS